MRSTNYQAKLFADFQADELRIDRLLQEKAKLVRQNKASTTKIQRLTKEVAHLKAQLASLVKDNDHYQTLAKTDSNNIGLPTSQTKINQKKRIPNSRVKSNKTKGDQKGHTKSSLAPFTAAEVTEHVTHELTVCPNCHGRHIRKTTKVKTKDELDFQIVIIKRRHEFPTYICDDCGKKSYEAIPNNLKEANQYGPILKAYALSLMNEANVSLDKTQRMIMGLTYDNLRPSQGYLAKLQKQAAKGLKPFGRELKQKLLKQKLLYWDDTVVMVNTKRACLRYYGTEKLALYRAHEHKDLKSIKDDALLTQLPADCHVMHDNNKVNYNPIFNYANVECNVHLMRDLQKCVDNTGHQWAKDLRKLISLTNINRKELLSQGSSSFDETTEANFYFKLNQALALGHEESKTTSNSYYAPTERALIKRIVDYTPEYFSWVTNFNLPFSNNLSERSLRGVKSKMKVAGQFENITSSKNYAAIRSYLETSYRNGKNPTKALERLMAGKPYQLKELIEK
ncbi:transposase [Lactobacillus sp. ESL0791]|uniref:IS66 family transposase n=1 Tax=Lactobacillus sp. ESL0791 TaxID=2983234 RepID=UPI0023F978CD|nr:transposase [Lactobacillus sp. ESL0791]MDF7638764.1 transposase [Lactobacillus sp. ESL0791]